MDTPLRIPAPAPESHIDAIPSGTWFLHTSPELCMKRLLASGFERIFQICPCWREGERGNLHLPEFTMLEWYRSGSDYRDLMDECESLLTGIAPLAGHGGTICFRGCSINLALPWERITVQEAFTRYAAVSMEEALEGDCFDEVMVTDIEPRLGISRPTFLLDYPAERGALARLREDDPTVAERFELYAGGLELANAFTELTDPVEQRLRFHHEESFRRSMGKSPYPVPEKFLVELSSMPPAAGIALGIDRLIMLLTDAETIDEVVSFTPEEL
ncbi:MAG: tRNA synthetase, class [Geobacteraceae bacterium]|nr:tRNA synthetase, class [Geobacteraceae bacterium]